MRSFISNEAADFVKRHEEHVRYLALLACLSLVVALGTWGALRLTGQAQNHQAKVLECPLELHTHVQSCYDGAGALICGQTDFAVHKHNLDCYDDSGVLVCQLGEHEEHEHTDACYRTERVLTCGFEESAPAPEPAPAEPHTHTDACYTDTKTLACGQQEHTHTDACYAAPAQPVLACTQPEHTHTDACYTQTQVETGRDLTCALPEHAHTDACYGEDGALACGMEKHAHADACYTVTYETQTSLTCAQAEHTHTDACYAAPAQPTNAPTCGLEEHAHTEDCYTTEHTLTCGLEEGAPAAETPQAPAEPAAPAHTHTDACYQTVRTLVCKEEQCIVHEHTEDCYTPTAAFDALSEAERAELAERGVDLEHLLAAQMADGTPAYITCGLPVQPEHTHGEECFKVVDLADDEVEALAPSAENADGEDDDTFIVEPGTLDTRTYEDDTLKATAAFAPEAGIPADAELRVAVIAPEDERYARRAGQAQEALGLTEEQAGQAAMTLLNIGFFRTDETGAETEVEPQAAVTVTVQMKQDGFAVGEAVSVVHFPGDEDEGVYMEPEILTATAPGEDGAATFVADSFSDFMLISGLPGEQPAGDTPAPIAEGDFTKYTGTGSDLDGKQVVIVANGKAMKSDLSGTTVTPSGNTLTNVSDDMIWVFSGSGNSYTLKNGNANLTLTGNHVSLDAGTGTVFAITGSAAAGFTFKSANSNFYLTFNNNALGVNARASTNFTLYCKGTGGSISPTPTPTPTPGGGDGGGGGGVIGGDGAGSTTNVSFTKYNEKNEKLSGAVFTLTGPSYPALGLTLTSDANGVLANGNATSFYLAQGDYKLEETTPPTGYKKGPDCTFTVDANGMITETSTDDLVDFGTPSTDTVVHNYEGDGTGLDGLAFTVFGCDFANASGPFMKQNGNSLAATAKYDYSDEVVLGDVLNAADNDDSVIWVFEKASDADNTYYIKNKGSSQYMYISGASYGNAGTLSFDNSQKTAFTITKDKIETHTGRMCYYISVGQPSGNQTPVIEYTGSNFNFNYNGKGTLLLFIGTYATVETTYSNATITNKPEEKPKAIPTGSKQIAGGTDELYDLVLTAQFEDGAVVPDTGTLTITDTLSDYVEFADLTATNIWLESTQKSGSPGPTLYQGNWNGTALTSTNPDWLELSIAGGQITAKLDLEKLKSYNPPAGAMPLDGLGSIALKLKIRPSAKAYAEYAKTGYPHKGGDGTNYDTWTGSAVQEGFFSNAERSATVTYGGTTKELPMPVVQVKAATLALVKHDEKGQPLQGAKFELYDETGVTQGTTAGGGSTVTPKADVAPLWVGTSDGSGNVTAAGGSALKLGHGTYYLLETDVPSGYAKPAAIVITVERGKITGVTQGSETLTVTGPNSSGQYSLTVTNHKKTVKVDLVKVSENEPGTKLAGAQFDLYKADTAGAENFASGTPQGLPEGHYTKVNTGGPMISADGTGIFGEDIELEIGATYYLVERKAPDGYLMLTGPVTITIESSGKVTASCAGMSGWAASNSDGSWTISVHNGTGQALPETGGTGAEPYTMGGSLLASLALVYIALQGRRGKQQ